MESGFLIVADVLLVIGLTLLLRNRSPYRRSSLAPPIDHQTQSRIRRARNIMFVGTACLVVYHALHWWRLAG